MFDPCPCSGHVWREPIEMTPREVKISLGAQSITDVLSPEKAQELEEKGVLKVEDLPLFLGRGPARVWARYCYPSTNHKVRRWERTCGRCGFQQETEIGKYMLIPVFEDPTPEENYVGKDGTVYG